MPKSLRSDTAGNANPGVNGTPSANALSPKKVHADRAAANRVAIEGHLRNTQCLLCGAYTPSGLCQECYQARQPSMAALSEHVVRCEDRLRASHAVCGSCTASNPAEPVECESLDCQWFYERHKAERGMELATFAREVIAEMEEEKEWEEGKYWVNEEDPENMEHNGNDGNLSDADAQSIATSDEWDGLYLDEDVL
jgi:DNA polymerase zeta